MPALTHLANKIEEKLCFLVTDRAKQVKHQNFLLEDFSLHNRCIMNKHSCISRKTIKGTIPLM